MFDAFLYNSREEHAVIFQATVSSQDSMKAEGISHPVKRSVREITYIVITPPDAKVSIPFPHEIQEGLIQEKYQIELKSILPTNND
jgi:hypothetical protein